MSLTSATRRAPYLPEDLIWDLEPGLHADGANLYLRVLETGSRSWVFVIYHDHRRREFGLGGARQVSIRQARLKARRLRERLARGAAR